MQSIKEIFIANTAEAFANLLERAALGNAIQQDRVQQEIDLSQRGQLWGGDNKIIITPTPIPEDLLKHNIAKVGYRNIKNLWPKNPDVRLCNSILDDPELIEALIQVFQSNKDVKVSSYSATEDYLNLLRFLEERIAGWHVVNLPRTTNPLDVVREIDSKNGFREMVANLFPRKNIKLPIGFICKTEADVAKAISFFLNAGAGFVIKVHNGESGWGVKIIDDDAVQKFTESKIKNWLRELFASDLIWNFAPYVVEQFISVDKTTGGGFPSGEGHITDKGFIFDYNCGQEVTRNGSFEGVVFSNDIIPDSVNSSMRIGMGTIGNELYSKGYRGVFDVDFAAGKDGGLYVLESNARMTGGTHVYHIMSYLGISGSNAYVISNDSFRYNMPTQKPEELLARLHDVLYPIENRKRGIIISFISLNRSIIGIITIGKNKKDALYLSQRAKYCLNEH
ncbi:MAG: hypothetical protein AAB474_00065 [Patescibacteria group bacterium]